MRAARLSGTRSLRIVEAPEPRPGPGEVAIRVEAVGICASDAHYYLHGSIGGLDAPDGLILGHEFAGVIAEAGPEVDPDLFVGQRVTAEPVRPCGRCPECRRDEYHLCRNLRFFGTPPADGALCDRVICLARWVFPLPDSMTMAEGAMMEPLAVGLHAASLSGASGGETGAVIGCGAIGLSVLQALRMRGVGRIHVEDPIPERVALAVEMGGQPEPVPPDGVDIVAECAGAPDTLALAMSRVRPGGTVMAVGIPDTDIAEYPASLARRREIRLQYVRRYRHCFPLAVRQTARDELRVSRYLTHRFPLERVTEAFELTASRTGGVIRAWIDMRNE